MWNVVGAERTSIHCTVVLLCSRGRVQNIIFTSVSPGVHEWFLESPQVKIMFLLSRHLRSNIINSTLVVVWCMIVGSAPTTFYTLGVDDFSPCPVENQISHISLRLQSRTF
jgi:hypothetical protein